MDQTDNTILETLDDLDDLLPVLNMAFISRAAGKGRGTFANWKSDKVDMTKTETRRKAREVLLQILKEVHQESGRILGEAEDNREAYNYLGKTDNNQLE